MGSKFVHLDPEAVQHPKTRPDPVWGALHLSCEGANPYVFWTLKPL